MFKISTNDAHPGTDAPPEKTRWLNGPNKGKTLAETSRPAQSFKVDPAAFDQEMADRRWFGTDDVGRMQVRSRRLGIEKTVLDGQIELAEMAKDYPYEFVRPGTGRPPWFYAVVVGVCLLQLTLLLVLVAHVTRRPTLPREAAKPAFEAPEVASAQGRAAAEEKGGAR